MESSDTFEVHAPRSYVFAVLADPRRTAGLDRGGNVDVTQVEGNGPESGARFRLRGSDGVAWLLHYPTVEASHVIEAVYGPEGQPEVGRTKYIVDDRSSGTTVRMDADVRMGAFAESTLTVFAPVYRWLIRRSNRRLARRIEREFSLTSGAHAGDGAGDIHRR